MKRWIISLGSIWCLLSSAYATQHRSFMATETDLYEESFYGYGLETPRMFEQGFPENLDPTRVEVPLLPGGFGIGLRALFLRAIDNQLDYVIVDPAPQPFSPSIFSSIKAIEPDNEFFFGGFLQYAYPFTGRDINLNGLFHQTNESDTTNAPSGGTLWTPLSLNGFLAARAAGATSDLDTDIILANLELGERIFAGTHYELHPFLGAGFADLERDIATIYFGALAADGAGGFISIPDVHITQQSRFAGGGPRFGINGMYHFTHAFGITGLIANTFYVGTIHSKSVTSEGIDSQGIHGPSINRVVPAIEGKLGVAYTHAFRTSTFKLEGGYQVNHFFNAFDSYRSGGNEGGYHIKLDHDLSLDGPYLEASVIGLTCPTHFSVLPVYLTVPRRPGGFELGVGGMALRPDDNQLDYALVDATPILVPPLAPPIHPSANATLRAVEPDYEWGYRLHAGYVFHDSAFDVMGNYQHYKNKENTHFAVPAGQTIWTILNFPIVVPEFALRHASSTNATVKFDYEQADFEFGFEFWAGELAQFRLFGGADFAKIYKDMHVTYNSVSTAPDLDEDVLIFPEENIIQKSHFEGAGPTVGFEMYLPFWFVDFHSRIAGSMLIGKVDVIYRDEIPEIAVLEDIVGPLNLGVNLNHDNRIVPAFETKIGITSNWSFFRNLWMIEVGYQLNHYFNAISQFKHVNIGPFDEVGPFDSSTIVLQDHDITFEGPYIDLTITGLGACPPNCIPLEPLFVLAPQLYGGFVFGLEAVSLRPDANNLDYALIDSNAIATDLAFVPTPTNIYKILEPSHDWGFRVNLGYHFPLTPTGVAINYFEYSSSDSESINAPADGIIWTILSRNGNFISPFPIGALGATASLTFDIHEFNFEFARHMKISQLFLRTYAGIGLDRLKQIFSVHYVGTFLSEDGTPAGDDFITQRNEFKGVGPRFGLDANFPFFYGLGVTGHAATNLLVGRFDSSFTEETTGFVAVDPVDTVPAISTALNPDSRIRIVPAITLKFGLSYTVMLPNCGQCSELIFEAGYEANHYFNVVDSFRFTTNTGEGHVKLDKDINLDGPYVKLTLIL